MNAVHGPVSRFATWGVAVFVALAGCEEPTAGGSGTDAGCPPNTKAQFDPNTGKLVSCAAVDDAGNVSKGDAGATGDGKTTVPDVPGLDTAGSGNDSTGSDDLGFPADFLRTVDCKPDATGLDKWFNCEPKPGAGGKLHGEACTKDDECLYGHCMFGLPVANYDKSIGVCTKNCGYVGGGSKFIPCDSEAGNPAGATYYCTFEKTKASGNTMRDTSLPNVFKVCSRGCKTDADCSKLNPALPTCLKNSTSALSTNPNGVCVKVK
ncbi:MAG: hypothetical protein FJ100_21965 [Deltaproteobacteria bacterium]|nr:hypothetical protein [Deltaproteobacteria bacterium]